MEASFTQVIASFHTELIGSNNFVNINSLQVNIVPSSKLIPYHLIDYTCASELLYINFRTIIAKKVYDAVLGVLV